MEWRKFFVPTLDTLSRISVRNPKTAEKIANAFVPEGSVDKVVIEAFPGKLVSLSILQNRLIVYQGRAS